WPRRELGGDDRGAGAAGVTRSRAALGGARVYFLSGVGGRNVSRASNRRPCYRLLACQLLRCSSEYITGSRMKYTRFGLAVAALALGSLGLLATTSPSAAEDLSYFEKGYAPF